MIRFAHLDAGLLATTADTATAALPLYQPTVRARIAARLRTAVEAGLITPSAVVAATAKPGGGDHGLAALGTRLQRKFRSMARIRPALPADLSPPFDPLYESAEMRRALHCWGTALLGMGAIKPSVVASSLKKGGRALTEAISDACASYASRSLSDLYTACGIAAAGSSDPLWLVRPAWIVLQQTSAPMDSVVSFPYDNTFTATQTLLTVDDAGAMLLFGALTTIRLRTLSLICPQEVGSEGFMGSMFLADLEMYAGEAVLADGTVTLCDDLLEHLENEHGIERDDEDVLDGVRKALRFMARRESLIPRFKSPASAVKALRAFASTLDNEAAANAMRGIASLITLNDKAGRSFTEAVSIESLEEESWGVGMHVVCADLTGFEDQAIDDVHEMNMNNGSEGGLIVQAPSAESAYRLAVREASVITVLSTLISAYAEAVCP